MKRLIVGTIVFALLSGGSEVSQAAPKPLLHKKIDLKAELTGRDDRKLSEDELYVEILSRYQSNRHAEMKSASSVFIKKFPESFHADNVLYLMGYSALERKNYSESLRYFDTLIKKYPLSNKAVSAEFARGTAFKQMKLGGLAKNTFLKVRKKYPQSPEFFRAESEIKLLMSK